MKLPPDIADALKRMPLGATILLEESPDTHLPEPCVMVKIPLTRDVWKNKTTRIGYGRMEVHTYVPEGPVIRCVYQIFDNPDNPLTVDAFLNPAEEQTHTILHAWAQADRLVIHGFDEQVRYIGTKILPWPEALRAGMWRAFELTKDKPVLWPAARDRCAQENPLSQENPL